MLNVNNQFMPLSPNVNIHLSERHELFTFNVSPFFSEGQETCLHPVLRPFEKQTYKQLKFPLKSATTKYNRQIFVPFSFS